MTRLARSLVGAGALLLAALYALPLWSITLFAPQYPEGLGMTIRLTTITGARPSDLGTINELNHYIGMKPIEPGAIPELRWFPVIVGALIVLGLVAALAGKRKVVIVWLSGLAGFGIAGLADFWRWAHDYGHNIDVEHAIIKIPGMTYQPPLIGIKQLLNFTASSWPAIGVYVALAAFALGVAALLVIPRSGAAVIPNTATPVIPSEARDLLLDPMATSGSLASLRMTAVAPGMPTTPLGTTRKAS